MRALVLLLLLSCQAVAALAQSWPTAVRAELDASEIPVEAVGLYVQEIGAPTPLLAWNADAPMNPASAMKLLTTVAALDLLGPAYTWRTEVYTDVGEDDSRAMRYEAPRVGRAHSARRTRDDRDLAIQPPHLTCLTASWMQTTTLWSRSESLFG